MWKPKHTEFRSKDYRTPRSMREAYGYDVEIYAEEDKKPYSAEFFMLALVCFVLVAMLFGIFKGVFQ